MLTGPNGYKHIRLISILMHLQHQSVWSPWGMNLLRVLPDRIRAIEFGRGGHRHLFYYEV